ncbi:MAG: TIGR00645 family protein [Hyphomonadaceae bacterium]
MSKKPIFEQLLEGGLFASRWLMAPFYVGLVAALGALICVFFQELAHEIPNLWNGHGMSAEDVILLALSLIDLSLAGNLVLIVIFSGYENFVSKMDVGNPEDRPDWMGTVDFSALKLKLIASIVAISGIALLKAFLQIPEYQEMSDAEESRLMWQVVVHLTFVLSGVLLALMDWLTGHQSGHAKAH